jgi:serine/threonine protein kinase
MERKFGKYRLLNRLGGGGMAEVWRAEVSYTKEVSKIVALKMIREDLATVKQFRSLFIDEARITSRISHTNVAQVFDFGEENGRPFLAMELVKGADLHSLMAAAGEQMRQIPLDVAAFITAEVARGLDHAHRLTDEEENPYGVVHRDVSPQNVLVSYAGEVKVTDFGIARARDKVTQTETGTVMGKFRYMSPEQVRGEALDARSDVFSCGILLYEMLAGRQLFDARTSAQVVDQIRYSDLPDLAETRPEADPALETVLRWTLERDVNKRCPDAATLARDLERYVHVAHPQFTRDRVGDLVQSLLTNEPPVPTTVKGALAYAGTELADLTGQSAKASDEPMPQPMRSLADLEPKDGDEDPDGGEHQNVDVGPDEPGTTARAKRGAPPEARAAVTALAGPTSGGPTANGVPPQSIEKLTESTLETDTEGLDASRNATLTLARRASRSASQPLARDATAPPHDAPTKLLDEGPNAEDRTRVRPSRPPRSPESDADSNATSETETRTAGPAHGEAAPRRASSSARRKPRRRGRGVETTLGVVLALLLLGGVALVWLRPDKPPHTPTAEPGSSALGKHGANLDAGVAGTDPTDGALPPTDVTVSQMAAIDQAITALEPEKLLAGGPQSQVPVALLTRLDRRLTHATVDDGGERRFGHPCTRVKPLRPPTTAADKLADLYAERLLADPTIPPLIATALGRLRPPSNPAPGQARQPDPVATLRALLAPKSAPLQESLILSRGKQKGWCKPLAGQDGQRYLYPHVIVARDSVARLLLLAPDSLGGRLWRRYLEAAPVGHGARLGGLVLTVKSSHRQTLKKDDNRVFRVTLTVRNQDPQQSVRVPTSGFTLHGVLAKPIPVGLWKPDLSAPLSPGKTLDLELTFAAPLGPTAETLVLAVPRAGAGFVWLRISSSVVQ